MENILEFFIRGVGMIIAAVAMTFFLSSQSVITMILDIENNSDYYLTDNASQEYEEYVLGHELVAQVYNDRKSIGYTVFDNSGTLVMDLVECNDLSLLSSINRLSIYDISNNYTGNVITQIVYRER